MSTLERAIALAATVHSGQRDKAGAPYILHPLRMMLKMKTVETQMAAMLHDVIEDCGVTPALLAHEGFPASVIEAVGALTKKKIMLPTARRNHTRNSFGARRKTRLLVW